MGWNIGLTENTVNINEKIAKDLFKAMKNECIWYDVEEVMDNNKLYFNSDHMENMDYVAHEKVQKILKKHKVEGKVCFLSSEGDNKGSFWGYEFDGKGNMFELEGKIVWNRV
jgi:site-specific DNA-adenine methylase